MWPSILHVSATRMLLIVFINFYKHTSLKISNDFPYWMAHSFKLHNAFSTYVQGGSNMTGIICV
jgi:hypothetical protein